jgi:hypothetical protein
MGRRSAVFGPEKVVCAVSSVGEASVSARLRFFDLTSASGVTDKVGSFCTRSIDALTQVSRVSLSTVNAQNLPETNWKDSAVCWQDPDYPMVTLTGYHSPVPKVVQPQFQNSPGWWTEG